MSAWTFPFRDRYEGRLTRGQWFLLVLFFIALHFLALQISLQTGNFTDQPNHDHGKYVRDIFERGYPSPTSSHVPPLYSYYIAFKSEVTERMGLSYASGKYFLDVFLVIAAGILSTQLGILLTHHRLIAALSGIGLVAAPVYIFGVAEELAVIFFQPFFLAALFLLLKGLEPGRRTAVYFLIAGILMGIATLIRAEVQFISLIFGPYVYLVTKQSGAHRRFQKTCLLIALFILMQGLMISPWLALQKSLAPHHGLTPFGGLFRAYFKGVTRHPGNRVSDWMREHYDEPERDLKGVLQFNQDWLKKDPKALAELYFLKYLRSWYISDSGRWDRPMLYLHLPFWVLAFWGLWIWIKQNWRDPSLMFVLLVIFYMWTVSAAVDGIARYSAPLYGFIGILMGVALLTIQEKIGLWLRRHHEISKV